MGKQSPVVRHAGSSLPTYKQNLTTPKTYATTYNISMVSCQKGPTRHAYAWQIGPFWQDTLHLATNHRVHSGRILHAKAHLQD